MLNPKKNTAKNIIKSKERTAKYDVDNQFDVELVLDPTRELNVLTTKVVNIEEREAKEAAAVMKSAGVIIIFFIIYFFSADNSKFWFWDCYNNLISCPNYRILIFNIFIESYNCGGGTSDNLVRSY